jgi:hypothetical protein
MCRLIVTNNVGSADTRVVGDAHRGSKDHGQAARFPGPRLADLGNGSEKARINSRLISGGWPFPWVRAPRGPLQIPELFGESWGARPGENNGSFGTVNGLKSDTAPSPKKYAITRLMDCSELPLYSIISSLPASDDVARGDLFGTAAERFRVGLRARVDDWVIRGVNAACHVGWQEQQLVLDFLRVQRLDDRDFAELHRRPAVRPDLPGIRDRIIGGRNLHQEAELDRSFFERCPEIVGKRIWSTAASTRQIFSASVATTSKLLAQPLRRQTFVISSIAPTTPAPTSSAFFSLALALDASVHDNNSPNTQSTSARFVRFIGRRATRTPDVAICNFPSFRRTQVVRNRKSRIVFIKCSDHIDLKIALVCHHSKSYLTSKKAALLGMLDWFAAALNLRRHE